MAMAEPLNVYLKWLGIPLHQQPPHSYRLLGIELFESDLDIIAHAADRQMSHIRTFTTGEHAALAHQLLNEIAAARVKLLNPQKKATYDTLLQADLVGLQGQPGPTYATAGYEVPPDINSDDDEPIEPIWRNPAVLATAGICCVLVVGICTALYLRSRPSASDVVAQTVPPVDLEQNLSPGELAAVPVEEEEQTPPPGTSSSNTTESTVTSTPEKAPPAEAVRENSVRTPKTPDTTPSVSPSQPSADPEEAQVAKVEPPTVSEEVDPNAFTVDDPGPPEPIDNGRPYTRPRLRQPVPPEAEQTRVLAEVKQIFKREYADIKSPEEKRVLGNFLMQQVPSIKDDPVSEYVMLRECVVYGKEGGDLQFTLKAIEQLEKNFQVDALEMRIDLLNDFARQAKNALQRQTIADFAVWLSGEAAKSHKFDTAEKLATQAQSMALRLGNDKQREKARDLMAEFKEQKIQWVAIQAAIDKLSKDPDDAQAHLVFGKHLCLEERDWSNGLEHLAESSDPRLNTLAKQDLAEPTDPDKQIELADAWHDLANSNEEFANFGYREHYWYLKAFPETTGLLRTKIERRLRDNQLVTFRDSWLSIPSQADLEKRN
jgi:hypothetical protein